MEYEYNPQIGDLLYFSSEDGPIFGMIMDIQNGSYPYRVEWVDNNEIIETNNDYRDICFHRDCYNNLRKRLGL